MPSLLDTDRSAPAGRAFLDGQDEALKPYLPRLLIEWIRDSPTAHYQSVDGSLVFVDISGFTTLTERLAQRGKIGAELLRDLLDPVFKAVLDEAYAWGAGLVKWGGDALLLLLDGPGHPERAARAAWEMQQAIGRVGRVRAAGRTTTLRMSIGIATDTIDFFLAGSVHRELVVVGRTATEVVETEMTADAGEIALAPGIAAVLPSSCVSRSSGVFMLSAPPEAVRGRAPDVGSVTGIDVASCIPVALREHVLLERTEPEHRVITAVFVDLMRTDDLLKRHGPERFGEALDERLRGIQESAARHEVPFAVTDISKGSVKVLLTAGAPSSTGHDEEQALRFAREVMDQPGDIPMRVGIETGRVFTGEFGPSYRRTYAVLGDAVNTAARVMTRAEAGQILATETVLARSRTTFATTPIAPFRAKGKTEPLRAAAVQAITGRRSERVANTPFVGRARELALLTRIVADVKAGGACTVEVAGPAGIGKSRLVRELLERTPGMRVLHAVCEEYGASTPYYAMRGPMRDLLGLDATTSPDETERRLHATVEKTAPGLSPWIPLLGFLLGLDLEPTPETSALDDRFLQETLADVSLRFIAAMSLGSPVAIVVEDAHFMDEASIDVLHRLHQSTATLPLVLIMTQSRPHTTWIRSGDESNYVSFGLLPLFDVETVEIIDAVTDAEPLRPHEVEAIARRAGGSPLFLIELLDHARRIGTFEALPDTVEAVVAAEIDRLAPSDRLVLRYASVLGTTFAKALLVSALPPEMELDHALWERLRGFLDADATNELHFRNTLVRDAAYEGLPFRRRRELHSRVAAAIEETASSLEDEAATLALHFSAANQREETWRYARLGGDRARAVAAHVEAARMYELALWAAATLRDVSRRDRADVLIALGVVRETAGLSEESYDALRRATSLLKDEPIEQARVFALRTRARVRTGSYARALRETAQGLSLVEGADTKPGIAARATLRAMRSEIRWFQGHPREAIDLAQEAVRDANDADELEAMARAYTALDGSYQMLGRPEMAVHERMALDIYTKLNLTRSLGITELNLGVQAYADGRWDEAVDLYHRAQEDCLRAGDRQHEAIAKANLGELLVSRGAYDEASSILIEARRVLRSSNYVPFALFAETQLARIALGRGQPAQALEALREIVDHHAESNAYAASALEGAIYFAEATIACGQPDDGLHVLDNTVSQAGDEAVLYSVAVGRVRGAALRALGELDEASAVVDRALSAARSQSLLYEQLLLLRQRASLWRASGVEPDEADLREAANLAQILGCPPDT